tara:strand:+ start:277 stop:696 length:420 start_codon:yes stop_codon:yes gene_type:complete
VEKNMAEFEVDGRRYQTENLSENQRSLLKSLSFTKDLDAEITRKLSLLMGLKKIFENIWEGEFGSNVVDVKDGQIGQKIMLVDGSTLNTSKLSKKSALCLEHLLTLNDRISECINQQQVLDTAKISYSKSFYHTLETSK